jgi:hypothetical protein
MKIKIGDKYRIIDNDTHTFLIGEIVMITYKYNEDLFDAESVKDNFVQCIHCRHIQSLINDINKNITIL